MKDNSIDTLLQKIGDEISMEIMSEEGSHKFSAEYKQKKDLLFSKLEMGEEVSKDNTPFKVKKRKQQRKVLLIAAALFLLSSMTVLAAIKIFHVTGMKDTETGTYTYTYAVDGEHEVPAIRIKANYIPEGYIECSSCGEGKYHLSDDTDHKSGFTILQSNTFNEEEIPYVSNVENIQINGIKSDVLIREGTDYNHVLLMFYEEQGYVIQVFATSEISMDELKKIGKNITFDVDTDAPNLQIFTEEKTDITGETLQVNKEQIISIGDEMEGFFGYGLEGDFQENISYKVTNLEIRDTLPEGLDETKFSLRDNLSISELVNENGTIKPYEREISGWENNELITETEEVNVKCIDLTLSITNTSDEKLTDVGVSPRIYFLNQLKEETYTDMPGEYVGNLTTGPFNYDRLPFYFDKTDFPNDTHFYFMGMDIGETKEVHLLYAIEEDLLENAYIAFDTNSDANNYNYIKILE